MNFENQIKNISLDGFQIVKSKYFSRQNEPVMSLFSSAIAFNIAAQNALNRCEFVEIYLNEKNKSIIIKPAAGSKENEAVRWRSGKEEPKYSRVECSMFAKPIFESWGLNPKYHYKATGRLVQCDKKVMLLFDFTDKEVWQGSKMVK